MTINKVKDLAKEKGKDLTYDDFKDYSHFDAGNGSVVFPINPTWTLLIGNFSDDYIELSKGPGQSIDIRIDDIDEFLGWSEKLNSTSKERKKQVEFSRSKK